MLPRPKLVIDPHLDLVAYPQLDPVSKKTRATHQVMPCKTEVQSSALAQMPCTKADEMLSVDTGNNDMTCEERETT